MCFAPFVGLCPTGLSERAAYRASYSVSQGFLVNGESGPALALAGSDTRGPELADAPIDLATVANVTPSATPAALATTSLSRGVRPGINCCSNSSAPA